METKRFDNQIKEVESELKLLETRYKEIKYMKPYKGQEEDLKQLGLEIEKVNNKLVNLNQQQKKSLGFTDVNKELNTTDKKLSGILKKVGKWALAVFGVRSAYMGIRRLMSTVSQYNKQIATDMQYIGYSLAKVFEPIISWIVSMLYKILSLITLVLIFILASCDGPTGTGGDRTIKVTDMVDRRVYVDLNNNDSIVCIGPGALRLYTYVGEVAKLVGAEDIDRSGNGLGFPG